MSDYPQARPRVNAPAQPLAVQRMRSSPRVLFIVPVGAAAKTINNILQEGEGTAAEPPKAAVEFVRECQLMSTFRHPNIVQFLGVAFFPGSRLPALVMERLLTSLHDLLAADAQSAPTPVIPSLSLSLSLSRSVSPATRQTSFFPGSVLTLRQLHSALRRHTHLVSS